MIKKRITKFYSCNWKTLSCILVVIFFALSPSCKKDQTINIIPSITFDSIIPNPAIKYVDTIRIVISYKDGDGDLGIDSADIKNLFVTDNRNNVVSQFRIPQLAPTGSNIAIEGNFDIILPPQVFINDNDSTETTTYSIYVVDRAGHNSNTINTAPLLIKNWKPVLIQRFGKNGIQIDENHKFFSGQY